ncbi:MAG: DNA primase [Ignavibacteriaceae bacterium]
MRISENKIEEIRSSANIVDVISDRIQLRKRGKNFLGLCPFHNEKTPSFTVSEEKQIYHCFGCHSGGNVFKFLMEYEKISFVESVQEIAQQLGIDLEFDDSGLQERQSEQEIFYDINSIAGRYFSDNLRQSSEGENARKYFENRNVKDKIMREFGLGYSYSSRDSFVNFLSEKKVDLEKALQLGLIGKANDGRLFDKFSGRIIFPIFSPNGRVVAFAGRILEENKNAAKYLNSPESLIYHKGKILYGLSHAKDEIRRQDKAILVEGYMDLISLYQKGIKNVVAVSGTALTEDQVQLLSRYTKNVILLFDSDTAGIKASMRSIELLLKRDIEIKIVTLPNNEDPDSYVNKFGKESFEDLIEKAQNFLEFQTAYYESQGMFEDPAKTAEAIKELAKQSLLINDRIKRDLYIKKIANNHGLREKLFEDYLAKYEEQINQKVTYKEVYINLSAFVNNMINEIGDESEYKTEEEILSLIFEGKEFLVELFCEYISIDEIKSKVHKNLVSLAFSSFKNKKNILPGALIQLIDDENIQSYLSQISFYRYNLTKNFSEDFPDYKKDLILKRYALDTIKNFKLKDIERKQKQIQINLQNNLKEPLNAMQDLKELGEKRNKIMREFDYSNFS